MTPAATGAADSLCALTVMGGELVAVVGERDWDSRDGDSRDGDSRDGNRGLMTFVAADDAADELKAYTLIGTVKRKKVSCNTILIAITEWATRPI